MNAECEKTERSFPLVLTFQGGCVSLELDQRKKHSRILLTL